MMRLIIEMRSPGISSSSVREFADDLVDSRLTLFLGFLVDLLDIFEAEPRIVGLAVGNLDMLGEKQSVLDGQARLLHDRQPNSDCSINSAAASFPSGTKFVGDLLGPAFFLEELALCFRRPAFGVGRAVRVSDDRVDDRRILDQ